MIKVALALIAAVLLSQIATSASSNDGPKLESKHKSIDNIQWTQVSDSNSQYKNWATYTRRISGMEHVYVLICCVA